MRVNFLLQKFIILLSDWSILKAQLLSLKEEKISFEQVNKLKFIIYSICLHQFSRFSWTKSHFAPKS